MLPFNTFNFILLLNKLNKLLQENKTGIFLKVKEKTTPKNDLAEKSLFDY